MAEKEFFDFNLKSVKLGGIHIYELCDYRHIKKISGTLLLPQGDVT
jgi:hypothetical protein